MFNKSLYTIFALAFLISFAGTPASAISVLPTEAKKLGGTQSPLKRNVSINDNAETGDDSGAFSKDFVFSGLTLTSTLTNNSIGGSTTQAPAVSFSQDTTSTVPLPASVYLFVTGLLGITFLAHRRRKNNQK